MEFAFRKLERADALYYRELRLKAFQESPQSFSEGFEDERLLPDEYFLSCMGEASEHYSVGCFYLTKQLVGIATFKRDKRSKARHKSYLHTMYVTPEFRASKIGKRLLVMIIDDAKNYAQARTNSPYKLLGRSLALLRQLNSVKSRLPPDASPLL